MEEEDIYDAIINYRNSHKYCEVCDRMKSYGETCDHSKNGYCALFKMQAEKDAEEFNMKKARSITNLALTNYKPKN